MAKVTAENFSEQVEALLDKYAEEVTLTVKDVIKAAAKQGANLVKSNASVFGGSGKYKRGWTSKVEEDRLSTTGIIYNRSTPGLPHLLEHGHAKRGGGRVPGVEHIAPAERDAIEIVQKELESRL